MINDYIFLGILILFLIVFLVSKGTTKSCFCSMGAIVCFGLLGHLMGAHYFGYVVIFLGLVWGIVILSFELTLFEKNLAFIDDSRVKIISGVSLFGFLGACCLIFKKNKNYFGMEAIKTMEDKDIFERIQDEHFVSMGLMMILIFVSLICVNVIIKKEK